MASGEAKIESNRTFDVSYYKTRQVLCSRALFYACQCRTREAFFFSSLRLHPPRDDDLLVRELVDGAGEDGAAAERRQQREQGPRASKKKEGEEIQAGMKDDHFY